MIRNGSHSPHPGQRHAVYALFLSDCHLGSPHADVEKLLRLVQSVETPRLYLVGDIIDGWALRRRWRWPASHTRFLRHVLDLARRGVDVQYTPGNHDEFLREFLDETVPVNLAHHVTHRSLDGRSFVVMHGDEFDDAIRMPRWQNLVGAFAYDSTIWLQTFLNGWRQRAGLPRTSWALRAREGLGLADRFIRQWEEIALAHAERLGQDGIICGHVHTPRIRQADRLAYINVGDWVENGVGLVEELDGSFRHVNAESVARVPSDAAAMPLSSAHGHLETPRDRQVETTEEVAGQPTW